MARSAKAAARGGAVGQGDAERGGHDREEARGFERRPGAARPGPHQRAVGGRQSGGLRIRKSSKLPCVRQSVRISSGHSTKPTRFRIRNQTANSSSTVIRVRSHSRRERRGGVMSGYGVQAFISASTECRVRVKTRISG